MRKTSAWPLALVSAALIIYASLYPFENWRNQGLFPWEFLLAPWPKYWTGFDVIANVLGYAPLGFWLTLGAMRSGRRRGVVRNSVVAAALLSFSMEGLQTYLPMRVPSREDWLLNISGAYLGALVAATCERMGWLERWSAFRARWFSPDAGGVLALMLLWPVALLFPTAVPLGLGQVQERLETALGELLKDTPFLEWLPFRDVELEPLVPVVELGCIALGVLIPCLLLMSVIEHWGRRIWMTLWIAGLGVGASVLSASLTFGPAHAWSWWSPAVGMGLALGLMLSWLCVFARARVCWTLLLLALMVQLFVLNQAPASVYLEQTLQTWEQGRFIRFHGLAQWLGWLWPFATLGLAVVRLSESNDDARRA